MMTKLFERYPAMAGNCVSNTKAGMNEGFVV